MNIPLGSKVKDVSTGFAGIVTSRTEYFNGCVQYYVEPPIDVDGKMVDGCRIDEEFLKILKGGIADQTLVQGQPKLKSVGGPKRGNPRLDAK